MAYQSRCEKIKVFKIIWESFKSICWKRVWVSQHLPWGHIARTLSIHANSVHLSSPNLIYPLLSMENPWNLCLKFWITPTSLTKPWAICLQLSSCDSIIFCLILLQQSLLGYKNVYNIFYIEVVMSMEVIAIVAAHAHTIYPYLWISFGTTSAICKVLDLINKWC